MRHFGRDLHQILNEAPVTDAGLLGNWNKPGGFKKAADKALVAAPGRLDKIKAAWGEEAHDFRLYFAQFKGGREWVEHGIASPEDIAKLGESIQVPQPVPDAVTVIFTNNSGDEWRAMTPWIIAHRVGHVMWAAARRGPAGIETAHRELVAVITRYIDEIAAEHRMNHQHFMPRYREQESGFYGDRQYAQRAAEDKKRVAVAHAFGAMRSARERNLRNFPEFVMETIAQYLTTGKVYLAPEHRPVVTRFSWGRPQTQMASDTERIETIKRDFEMEVPTYIDNLIERCKGKIFVM